MLNCGFENTRVQNAQELFGCLLDNLEKDLPELISLIRIDTDIINICQSCDKESKMRIDEQNVDVI